ncbi:hypothetical protein PVAP13_4KG359952 [Panicum virgatum]|uniref:BTB domain-containing protein n=1 Tax=Panicum virgatum TaxID=38727 RepID=A0A8T0TUV9_PANVG|nr:hypothetical protein PVAP13_4KG359952 [Panicum virgatum]
MAMLASSMDLTGAARSVQLFKIGGFAATKEKPGYTASAACAVGGLDWRIEFHPKASNPNRSYSSDDWIKFSLRLISSGASGVAASFSCRLLDPSSPGSSHGLEEMTVSSLFYANKSLDVHLIQRSDLQGSNSNRRYVKDDCIYVQCAINVLLGEPKDAAAAGVAAAPNAVASVPSSDLHQQFGELLRSEKGTDITFLVAGEPVAAHRSVLAARSPVFMAEFFGDMKEKAAEVFRAMLHFVYTDTAPELDQEGEQATLMAQHLLEAADRVDTVATTLALAEQHGCSELKSRCMKFILATPENLQAVAATEGYKHLEACCPSVLTELLKLIMVKGNK